MNKVSLLLKISRCCIASNILKGIKELDNHSCRNIVMSQCVDYDNFQVPEPWSGHIEKAPILFIDINPSISKPKYENDLDVEEYPTNSWSDEEIVDFFENRFDGKWVLDGRKNLRKNNEYRKKPVLYWSNIITRTETLIERSPKYGLDYAFTHIVHCKSKEQGPAELAIHVCIEKFLDDILRVSGACVIILIGDLVKNTFTEKFDLDSSKNVWFMELGGKQRYVMFLPRYRSAIGYIGKNIPKEDERAIKEFLKNCL